jgi:hypothetical protein
VYQPEMLCNKLGGLTYPVVLDDVLRFRAQGNNVVARQAVGLQRHHEVVSSVVDRHTCCHVISVNSLLPGCSLTLNSTPLESAFFGS